VVGGGGAGRVRAWAHALAGTRVPRAIIPLGTANLAARALGIPPGIGAALAAGFGGHERRIDLAAAGTAAAGTASAGPADASLAAGGAGTLTFAAMAGIRLGAEGRPPAARPGRLEGGAGWLAYAVAGAAHLPGRPERFTVRLDGGEPLARQARCVVVGNAGLLPGGFVLLPGARLDDGLLDVGILAPSGPAGWLRGAQRVLTGSGRGCRGLERHQALRVVIRAPADVFRS